MGVVLRQRTVAVVERDLAHTRRGVLLNRPRTCDERAEMTEERAYHWIFCADRRGQLVGLPRRQRLAAPLPGAPRNRAEFRRCNRSSELYLRERCGHVEVGPKHVPLLRIYYRRQSSNTAHPSVNFRHPTLNLQIQQRSALRRSRCASHRAGPAPPGDTLTLTTWRERNRDALREFWALAPADAMGVKQEFEKALAQDGKPAKLSPARKAR